MTAEEIQVLYGEAKCFICRGVSEAQALKLALEVRWLEALNPDAITTPEGLEEYGKCFLCYTNANMFDLYEISLLDQIADAA